MNVGEVWQKKQIELNRIWPETIKLLEYKGDDQWMVEAYENEPEKDVSIRKDQLFLKQLCKFLPVPGKVIFAHYKKLY